MRRITNSDQFASLEIYEDRQSYFIKFRNPERLDSWINATFILLAVFAIIPVITWGEELSENTSIDIGIGWRLLFWLGLFVAVLIWRLPGKKIPRTIELDFGADRLRVYRKNRVEVDLKLQMLHSVSIDEHPEAERERRKSRDIGVFQKTHCLYGWFGERGSNREELVCRFEWPSHGSLMEVGEAIKWALEKGPPGERRESAAGGQRMGMKPPLD